jgi:hypothetical protein
MLVAAATAGLAGPPATPAEVLARFDHEPSVREVQRAAARFAGADPERLRSWRARVRKAPWLPQVRVRVQRGFEDDLLINASGQTRAVDDDLTIEVRAQWELDRLIFDRNELYLSREEALLSELRQDAVAEVTRLYFERRWLQVELLLDPPASLREAVRRSLRIRELAAALDGLTGGFFGRALRRSR